MSVAVVLPPRRRHATPRYLRAQQGQICISTTRNPANLRVLTSKAGPTTSRSGGGAAAQSYAWRVRFRDRDDSMRSSDSMGEETERETLDGERRGRGALMAARRSRWERGLVAGWGPDGSEQDGSPVDGPAIGRFYEGHLGSTCHWGFGLRPFSVFFLSRPFSVRLRKKNVGTG